MMTGDYNIRDILNAYPGDKDTDEKEIDDELKRALKPGSSGSSGSGSRQSQEDGGNDIMHSGRRAVDSMARNGALDDRDRERYEKADRIEKAGYDIAGRRLSAAEFQAYLGTSFANAMRVKNSQKVILMANKENVRKGLGNEIGAAALVKIADRSQTSSISIPTQLLRYIQQEVGALDIKATQNDIVSGFLYWYFGRPEDVGFERSRAEKIGEIVANLDRNSSSSRMSAMSYNASSEALERIGDLSEKMDTMLSMMADLTKDSLDSRIKADKSYIALCYNILNMLALTPPIAPGEQAKDVDIMAGGLVWELMMGVDMAYDYYRMRNGREIYKAKFRKQPKPMDYRPQMTYGSPVQDDRPSFRSEDYAPLQAPQAPAAYGAPSAYASSAPIQDTPAPQDESYTGNDYDGYDAVDLMSMYDDDYGSSSFEETPTEVSRVKGMIVGTHVAYDAAEKINAKAANGGDDGDGNA